MPHYEETYAITPRLEEDRSFWKYLLLSIVTLGIYNILFFIKLSFDINKIASRHDGKKTLNYMFALLLALFTFGIFLILWMYGLTTRVADELERRGMDEMLTPRDFWLWYFLGSLIIVGPFVFLYKLIRTMNALSHAYNEELEASAPKPRPKYS